MRYLGPMQMIRLLYAILGAFPSIALALGGTSSPDAWFARPQSECPNNGNGLAVNCAASGGASGAFNHFNQSGMWTTTTGIDDNDSLYFCHQAGNSFGVAERRNATTELDIDASGTSGNTIAFNGDCSAWGFESRAVIDGANSTSYGSLLDANGIDYLVFQNLEVKNLVNGLQLGATNSSTSHTGIRLENIYSHDVSNNCINIAPLASTIDGLTIRNCGLDGLYVYDGAGDRSELTVNDFLCENINASGGTTGDCFQNEDAGDAASYITMTNVTMRKNGVDKSAALLSVGGVCTVTDGTFEGVPGNDSSGITVERCGSGHISRLRMHGFARACIAPIGSNGETTGTLVFSTIDCWNSVDGFRFAGTHATGVFEVINSTLTVSDIAVEEQSTFAPAGMTVKNSAISGTTYPVSVSAAAAATPHTFESNRYPQGSSYVWSGSVKSSFAVWKSSSGLDATSAELATFGFVSPTDHCTKGTSTLRNAGACVPSPYWGCAPLDIRGRARSVPPDIGACEATSGDEAAPRAAAISRANAFGRSFAAERAAR